MKSIWELDIKNLISPTLLKLQAQAKDTFQKFSLFERKADSDTEHTTASLRTQHGVLGDLQKGFLEFFAIQKFIEVGQEIFTTGMALELARTHMQTMTGSVKEGNQAFENLINFQKRFPILSKEAMLAAGENLEKVKLPAQQLQHVLYNLGSVTNGNSDATLELSQMYAKAYASGFVNNRMLLNQPALLQAIEAQIGKNGVAFRKYQATGAISIDVLNTVLDKMTATGGTFHNALENAMNTTAGHIAKLKEQMHDTGQQIYKALEPVTKKLLEMAEKYLPMVETALRTVWHTARGMYDFYQQHELIFDMIAGGVMAFAAALGFASLATWALEVAFAAFNFVLSITPLGWIIIAIGAVTGAVIYCWNHFEGFRQFLYSLWETIKVVFTAIYHFIWDRLKGIAHIWMGVFTLNWGMVKQGFKESVIDSTRALTDIPANVKVAWGKGQQEGHESWIHSKATGGSSKSTNEIIKNSLAGNAPSGNQSQDLTGGATQGGTGGASGKNISVTINGGLVHELHIHAATITEGLHQLKDKVGKALIATVNDYETAM